MIFGTIAGLIASGKQKKAADAINPVKTDYQTSPYAQEMLNMARMRMNSQMPGSGQMARGVQQQQANMVNTAKQAASSGNQVLAMAGAGQENANQAMNNLVGAEASWDQQNMGNLVNAQGTMIREGDKVFQDQLRDFERDFQTKWNLRNSSWQNLVGSLNGLDEGIATIAGSALGGGIPIGQMFKGKKDQPK